MDNLIICPRCESDACYVDEVSKDIKTHFCYGCGFQTNSLMKEEEEFYNQQIEFLPELYKDLIYTDENGLKWMPSAINVADKGMVFANGTSSNNWNWSAVKAVPVTEEEKEKYPIPNKEGEFYEWRMDMTTKSNFSERDFMDALSYIKVIPE
jgi:hypothetical protein